MLSVRFLVTLSIFWLVTVAVPHANSMPKKPTDFSCEQALTDANKLRYFRSGEGYVERQNGTYFSGDRSLRYLPGTKKSKEATPLVNVLGEQNFGSHLEIIRRQLGTKRFINIMESDDPDHALVRAIRNDLAESEDQENVEDAETLKQIIESDFGPKDPLSENRARQVIAIYQRMGRTAPTLVEWLEPLLRGNKLRQLNKSLLQDPIEKTVRPNIIIYKAIQVKLMLDVPTTFFISAGESGSPDTFHEILIGAITMVVPKSRILSSRSGYLVIENYIPKEPRYGSIKFVTKGFVKETLASEGFDFRDLAPQD